MFDLFDLERLFNSWLSRKGSNYKCEIVPKIKDLTRSKNVELDIYIIYDSTTKVLIHKIVSSGAEFEKMWEKARDDLFAYFMEVGKDVQ